MPEIARNEEGFYCGPWRGREVRLPSVTTVLSLLSSYDKVSRDIMDRAAKFGSAVHKIVELHERGTLDEASLRPKAQYLADMTPILEAWKRCKLENDVRVFAAEQVVLSLKHQYAGRLDVVAMVKGVPAIVEIKSRPYNPMLEPLQTAAYFAAWNEQSRLDAPGWIMARERWFCELRLDGGYDFRPIKGKNDFHYFRCCLAAWNWREGNGGK